MRASRATSREPQTHCDRKSFNVGASIIIEKGVEDSIL